MFRYGASRIVFCVGNYAFKFPRLTQLEKGLIGNRWEIEMWKVWRPNFGWENLCPIIISDPSGFVLIMKRSKQPVAFDGVKRVNDECYGYYPDINVEYKPENWGEIEGKIVCLDYGLEDEESVIKQRTYLQSFSK